MRAFLSFSLSLCVYIRWIFSILLLSLSLHLSLHLYPSISISLLSLLPLYFPLPSSLSLPFASFLFRPFLFFPFLSLLSSSFPLSLFLPASSSLFFSGPASLLVSCPLSLLGFSLSVLPSVLAPNATQLPTFCLLSLSLCYLIPSILTTLLFVHLSIYCEFDFFLFLPANPPSDLCSRDPPPTISSHQPDNPPNLDLNFLHILPCRSFLPSLKSDLLF